MEHKARKMLALGAVIMLCAVAIIGAGYAAFSNTATARTYNEGNSATAGYMTITPDGTGAAAWDAISTTDIVASFSTYVYKHSDGAVTPTYTTEKAYYFADDAGASVHDLFAIKLGETKTFTVANQTGTAIASFSMNVKAKVAAATDIGTNAEFKYFLKIGDQFFDIDSTMASAEGVTKTVTLAVPSEGSETLNVELYIGYTADVGIPEDYIGDVVTKGTAGSHDANNASDANAPKDMINVSFAFAISAPVASAP